MIRRDPRDLGRIYVLDAADGSYLEVPYRELSRPPASLWEHRLARARLRQHRGAEVDEGTLFAAIEEMRAIETEAKSSTRSARRNRARRLGLRVIEEAAPASRKPALPWGGRVVGPSALELFDIEEW